MNRKHDAGLSKIKRLQNAYNLAASFIWSALSFIPLTVYWYSFLHLKQLLVFSAFSIIPIFLSNSFLNKIQLSNKTIFYKKLGVPIINAIAQNGTFINHAIRKKYPNFKEVTFTKTSAKQLLRQTYFYEKFHLILFIFFILTTIHAFTQKHFGWAFLFLIINLFYNVYPNLLQQYIRVKLNGCNIKK